jgi:methionyl-tRNA formyltransferase
MTPRVDAGGMLSFGRVDIGPDETAGELEARLARLGAPLVVEAIESIAEDRAEILPQNKQQVTKAPKLRKEDGQIDWSQPAQAIHNLVRAMQPWPQATTSWHTSGKPPVRLIVQRTALATGVGEPGTILEAGGDRLVVAAGSGAVSLLVIQVPGRRALPVQDFLRGYRVSAGDRMGADG